MNDILFVISNFANRNDLLNFLSICKIFRQYDKIFFNKYFIDRDIINGATKEFISKIRLIENVSTIDHLINNNIKKIIFNKHFNQNYLSSYFF